ncbi:MAG TPA: carbohydrate binding domain-containing protein [Draconibacterium sp.]|nr:carbohydrate binding domain-containing protein [Draconibacterium sp.]
MNKLRFPLMVVLIGLIFGLLNSCAEKPAKNNDKKPGIAVLLVDTDRKMGQISENIYGQFLEHINHSVVDGLYAEQVRGQGFEGNDFEEYWETFSENGNVAIENVTFKNGEKSVRINVNDETAGIRQGRFFIQKGSVYNGSVWLKPEEGSVSVSLIISDSEGGNITEQKLETSGNDWQEVPYSFTSDKTDTMATIEIAASGNGSVLCDFISLMLQDARENGMLRSDLFNALDNLKPTFIRWPGGSYASVYKWKDGIGPQVSRKYHPNEIWGGYSDYYGFGTEEFMSLCQKLGTDPMLVLPATTTDPEALQYAIDWVHYLLDPATTEWGKLRAANGHPEPYDVPYIQIDNEPMNHGLSPDEYAEIVNVYGSRIREIAPDVKIVACGQKRSNDMNWSEKVVDIAGENFDILGCHNYEYESDKYKTGVRRIEEYLVKLRNYILKSAHPDIKIGILEWNVSRTYDWRAGMHAAGSLISYEKLGPELEFSCPALLMRNTSDDPTWTAWIYHDHVSWFPGGGYVVEDLFRKHYAEIQFASTSGTFAEVEDPFKNFIDGISQFKPTDWRPGTVDAIATGSADGKRIIIKTVNYEGIENTLITRIQGSKVPENATVKTYTIQADKFEKASLDEPNKFKTVESSLPFENDLKITLMPYSVMVLEIVGN